MPAEFVGLLSPEQYEHLMGLAGICSAFLILMIWARGL